MATLRYKYTGTYPVHVPEIGREVNPGETIETEHAVKHPDFDPITDHKKKEDAKATK